MSEKSLYQQLAEAVGAGESKYIRQILETLADEAEARLLIAASPPGTVEELAERSGLEKERVEQMIDPLFAKGLLFKSKKPEGTRYYRFRHLLQLHDATGVMVDPPPRMLALWKAFTEEEFDDYSRMMEEALPDPVLRVIPVNVSVEPVSRVMAFDDIREVVANAKNLAVTPCSCRVIDGACGKPLDVCVQIDKAADYAIERGTGRKIDKDEALSIMKMSEEEGLIHVSDNRRSPGHIICNCCSDCCVNWSSVRKGLGKFVVPSRFTAKVDESLCSSCETCVERCQFDAIEMAGENDTASIIEEKCMGCGVCLVTCPEEALSLAETRPEDFIPG
jgi:Pyruvate/2-oxoacid:ferredoxin oxidoreductase delta subunit